MPGERLIHATTTPLDLWVLLMMDGRTNVACGLRQSLCEYIYALAHMITALAAIYYVACSVFLKNFCGRIKT